MMARRRRKELSERQIRILDVLDDFQKKFGYPPSIRDLCDKANISSTSVVNYYLDQLEEMGYIERDQGVSPRHPAAQDRRRAKRGAGRRSSVCSRQPPECWTCNRRNAPNSGDGSNRSRRSYPDALLRFLILRRGKHGGCCQQLASRK